MGVKKVFLSYVKSQHVYVTSQHVCCGRCCEEDYGDDYLSTMQQLLDLLTGDIKTASHRGIKLSSGALLHPIPLGCKGDWSFLVA